MAEHDEYAELILGKVAPQKPFQPQVYYDRDGDCIEFLATDEPFRAERIDSLVTVYYGEQSGEIVGSLIKGVKRFLDELAKRAPGFRIEVVDGRIRLEHLFSARLWCCDDVRQRDALVLTYQRLRDVAEQVDAEAELCAT